MYIKYIKVLLICLIFTISYPIVNGQKLIVKSNEEYKSEFVYYKDPVTGEIKNVIIDTNFIKLGTTLSVVSREIRVLDLTIEMIEIGNNFQDSLLFSIYIPNGIGLIFNDCKYECDSTYFRLEFKNADMILSNINTILKFEIKSNSGLISSTLTENQIELVGNGEIIYNLNDFLRINCIKCIRYKQ